MFQYYEYTITQTQHTPTHAAGANARSSSGCVTLSLIDAQTSAGHTALHFAFAYGYKDLGKYLLSLGADDTVANVHGMTCYEGLDPDEPPRDCLNTPEMRELARSATRCRSGSAASSAARAA